MHGERTLSIPAGYEELARILQDAIHDMAFGKGKTRHVHGSDAPWQDQGMIRRNRVMGVGAGLAQIVKKAEEAAYMNPGDARLELLGVINYAAGVIYTLENTPDDQLFTRRRS